MTDFSLRFAHSLASHDVTKRDSGVTAIEDWVHSSAEFTEVLFLKAWKALFYCFWHSDKPLVQHALAQRLAGIMHGIKKPEHTLLWMSTFWKTINREWKGIDVHRMDKFYAFARYFLNETFSFLLHKNWNPELILAVVKVLSIRAARFLLNEQNTLEEVESEESEDSDNSDESESEDSDGDMRMQRKLKPKNIDTPDAGPMEIEASRGLVYHMLFIYVCELAKTAQNAVQRIPARALYLLSLPMIHLLYLNIDEKMLMMQVLMKKTVAAWNEFKKERFSPKSEEIGDEEASDLTTEDITHLQLISQHLFQLATRDDNGVFNRAAAYRLRAELEVIIRGVTEKPENPKKRKVSESQDKCNKEKEKAKAAQQQKQLAPRKQQEKEKAEKSAAEKQRQKEKKERQLEQQKQQEKKQKPLEQKQQQKKQQEHKGQEKKLLQQQPEKKSKMEQLRELLENNDEAGEDFDLDDFLERLSDEEGDWGSDSDEEEDGEEGDERDSDEEDSSNDQEYSSGDSDDSEDTDELSSESEGFGESDEDSDESESVKLPPKKKHKSSSGAIDYTKIQSPKPKTAGRQIPPVTPVKPSKSSTTTPSPKKVIFNLKKNDTVVLEKVKFKTTPVHKTKQPDTGILKTPPPLSPKWNLAPVPQKFPPGMAKQQKELKQQQKQYLRQKQKLAKQEKQLIAEQEQRAQQKQQKQPPKPARQQPKPQAQQPKQQSPTQPGKQQQKRGKKENRKVASDWF